MAYIGAGITRFNTADDLTVTDDATIQDDASVGGNLSVTGTTTLTDDLNVDSGTLFVDASANAVGIGNTIPSSFNAGANNLVVGTGSGSEGITIYGGAESNIFFADGTATADNLRGRIEYSHLSEKMLFYVNNSFATSIDSSATLFFNSGYGSVAIAYGVRAWVNFSGVTSTTIRADGNVSSVTYSGSGDYTVNFTNAMPDANYAAVKYDNASTGTGAGNFNNTFAGGLGNRSTTSCRILSYDGAGQDSALVDLIIVR